MRESLADVQLKVPLVARTNTNDDAWFICI